MTHSPSPTPDQDHLEELMTGYVLDALSAEERVEFERLVQLNPDLMVQVQSLQEVMGLLAYTARASAPAHLRDRLLAIPQTASLPTVSGSHRSPPRRWLAWAGAIAAVLVLALGIDNYRMRQRVVSLEAALATHHGSEEDYAFKLKGTGTTAAAWATVIVNAELGQIFVGVKNLPTLPTGQTYYLWAFTDDNTKILCGQFNTNASGQWVNYIQVDPAIYTSPVAAMKISQESVNRTPDANSTAIVLTSETL